MSSPRFTKGQLIRWFEKYADGDLTKDAGTGIIIGMKKYFYESFDGTVYEYQNFEVYRNKFNDIITLSENEIESL